MSIKQKIVTAAITLTAALPGFGQNNNSDKSAEQEGVSSAQNIKTGVQQKVSLTDTASFGDYRPETVTKAKKRVKSKTEEWHVIESDIKYSFARNYLRLDIPKDYVPTDVSPLFPKEFSRMKVKGNIGRIPTKYRFPECCERHSSIRDVLIGELQDATLNHMIYKDLQSREANGEYLNSSEKEFMNEHIAKTQRLGLGMNEQGLYQTNDGNTFKRITYLYNRQYDTTLTTANGFKMTLPGGHDHIIDGIRKRTEIHTLSKEEQAEIKQMYARLSEQLRDKEGHLPL